MTKYLGLQVETPSPVGRHIVSILFNNTVYKGLITTLKYNFLFSTVSSMCNHMVHCSFCGLPWFVDGLL